MVSIAWPAEAVPSLQTRPDVGSLCSASRQRGCPIGCALPRLGIDPPDISVFAPVDDIDTAVRCISKDHECGLRKIEVHNRFTDRQLLNAFFRLRDDERISFHGLIGLIRLVVGDADNIVARIGVA